MVQRETQMDQVVINQGKLVTRVRSLSQERVQRGTQMDFGGERQIRNRYEMDTRMRSLEAESDK